MINTLPQPAAPTPDKPDGHQPARRIARDSEHHGPPDDRALLLTPLLLEMLLLPESVKLPESVSAIVVLNDSCDDVFVEIVVFAKVKIDRNGMARWRAGFAGQYAGRSGEP